MCVTIFDVAKEAEVSKSTVSLVINKSNAVKPETRDKVLAAIEKLKYIPNASARELMTKKKQLLGSIFVTNNLSEDTYSFDSIADTMFYETFRGISNTLAKTDYGLVNERFSVKNQFADLPQVVKNDRVAGLFIIGGLFNSTFIDNILQRNLPVVIIGSQHPLVDSVDVDICKAAYIGVKYLTDCGHKDIAFIDGPDESTTSAKKLEGYIKALNRAGIESDEKLIRKVNFTGLDGYKAMKDLWQSGIKMTAVFCASDATAAGAMRYLYEQHVRIPDAFSVVGYEHSVISEHLIPALTTVKMCKEQMGSEACKLLLNRIQQPSTETTKIILQPELIIRDSVRKI